MATTTTGIIAERVTLARKQAAVTEVALAEAVGLARTTLRRKLQGHDDFSVPELVRIGKRLGTFFGDWLTDLPEDDA